MGGRCLLLARCTMEGLLALRCISATVHAAVEQADSNSGRARCADSLVRAGNR